MPYEMLTSQLGRITGQLWIAVSTSMASSLPVFGGLALRFGCSLPCLVSYGVLTTTYEWLYTIGLRTIAFRFGCSGACCRVPNRQLSLHRGYGLSTLSIP